MVTRGASEGEDGVRDQGGGGLEIDVVVLFRSSW